MANWQLLLLMFYSVTSPCLPLMYTSLRISLPSPLPTLHLQSINIQFQYLMRNTFLCRFSHYAFTTPVLSLHCYPLRLVKRRRTARDGHGAFNPDHYRECYSYARLFNFIHHYERVNEL